MNNVEMIILAMILTVGLISFILRAGNVQKLLVWACLEAEKRFGSKTGQIKLKYVYDWFTTKYPIISSFVSFGQFSKMVDIALEEMRHLIQTNMGIFEYVSGIGGKDDE